MQNKPSVIDPDSNKPVGLYVFNTLFLLLVVFLQFQNILAVSIKQDMPKLSLAIYRIDKVFIFLLFSFFVFIRFCGGVLFFAKPATKRISFFTPLKNELVLLGALTVFCIWCLVSSVANQNSLKPTVFGTFAYIAYFLVFFVFSSIPYKNSLIKMNYAFLLKLALFLSVVSVLQEILAFIYPFSAQWWPNIQKGSAIWRFGLFRAPSLLGHPNGIGMCALIFFTVELTRIRQPGSISKWVKITILGLAILFSLSKTAIGGALIALFLILPLFRKRLIFFLPVIVLTGVLIYNLFGLAFFKKDSKFIVYDSYRKYTFNKSIEIFKDNCLFGVGPGMYGGHISHKYGSNVYLRYGFQKRHYDYLRNRVSSIEQEWVQLLAELGVPGLFLFVFLILTPMFILYKLKKSASDPLLLAMINGFMIMPFQMGLYMISFNLSQQPQWLFPYFAFLGMLVGAQRRDNYDC